MGRFIFDNDENQKRASSMGIKDFNRKYELNEIVSGDSIFCATGITSGDLVKGIEIKDNKFTSETLITHKSAGLKKIIKSIQKNLTHSLLKSLINNMFYNKRQFFGPFVYRLG